MAVELHPLPAPPVRAAGRADHRMHGQVVAPRLAQVMPYDHQPSISKATHGRFHLGNVGAQRRGQTLQRGPAPA